MEVGEHEKKGVVLNLETTGKNKNLLVKFSKLALRLEQFSK